MKGLSVDGSIISSYYVSIFIAITTLVQGPTQMIRVSVSETKNRLSHYIRLVRGGEEVEIMDRNTPVAKIVHISKSSEASKQAAWTMEAIRLGLITPPREKKLPATFFQKNKPIMEGKGVLQALLQEREEGR